MKRAVTNGAEKVDSWWASTARPAPRRPTLTGDVAADVAVLGGGYTGLSTALHLVERGYQVALVEGCQVGWAASGRNGGQIVTAFNPTLATLGQWVGAEDARRLWDMSEEAKRLVADTVGRHRIDCDLTWGYVFAGLRPRHAAALAAMAEEWAGYGYGQARLLGKEEVRAHIGSPHYTSGLYDSGGGHLHPLNYARGLASACEAAGVAIYENSPVTALDTGASPSMTTAAGRVRARFLVLGGNALLGRLAPSIRGQIAPVATYIAATEKLGRARIRSVLADDIAASDMNFVLNYFRRTPDHRLLFGAGVSYSGIHPANLRATIRRAMLKVFPQLGDVRLEQCWGGLVDISMNRVPHLGRLSPTTYFAQGFSGHGVALTAISGKVIAEAIAGQAERFDVFAKVPHARFPGGPLRIPALVLAMTWYRLRDLI